MKKDIKKVKRSKGRTVISNDSLTTPDTIIRHEPVISDKFDTKSLYYDGVYYFVDEVEENKDTFFDKPLRITIAYFSYKWFQDYRYIDFEFYEFLKKYWQTCKSQK